MPTTENPHPAQGLRPPHPRPVCRADRRSGGAHRRVRRRPCAAADRDQEVHREQVAVRGQGLARAVRDPHPQAPDRHHRAVLAHRRHADAAAAAGGRRHRDQAVGRRTYDGSRLLGRKLGMTAGVLRQRRSARRHRRRGRALRRRPDQDEGERTATTPSSSASARASRSTTPLRGHLKRLGQFRYLREVRVDDPNAYELGQKLGAELFEEGDIVDVVGTSKGRASPVASSATTSPAVPRRTASRTATAPPARSAPARRPAASAKVCAWPATWATSA